MSENMESKELQDSTNKIPDEETNDAVGGQGGAGCTLTVGPCNGTYLALRPQPVWDQDHELAQLYPGYTVFTYFQTTNGTGLEGVPCTYTYVKWNGIWGWADSSFLR